MYFIKNTTIEHFKNTRSLKFVMNLTVLFIEKSKYYISEAQKISYEDRMRHHLFVLIAPKRSERYQTFMTAQKYEALVTNLRSTNTWQVRGVLQL